MIMKNSLTVMKILLLPTFIIIAVLRILFDNNRMVSYLNIISLAFAINVLLETAQEAYNDVNKQYKTLVILQFINGFAGILFFLYEFQFHKINNTPLSDAIAIIAFGISLPNNTLAKLLILLLNWIFIKDKKVK